jgi:hypothetical protein
LDNPLLFGDLAFEIRPGRFGTGAVVTLALGIEVGEVVIKRSGECIEALAL